MNRLNNPSFRLKLCNRTLGITLLLMLVTGIQLETTSGRYPWSVWVHIILGILLAVLSLYHIYLHYRRSNWFARFATNRNASTRILWWVFLLTAVTGIASTISWLADNQHTPLGGVHGKIGFLMVIVAIIHAVRHIRKKKRLARVDSVNS